jgi:intracellular multiplication protein IcmD
MSDDIGSIASNVTSSSDVDLEKAITGASEAAGAAYSVASIEEFKRHKDNPTQIPVGTPKALEVTAAALEVAPSLEGTGDAASDATAAKGKLEEKL